MTPTRTARQLVRTERLADDLDDVLDFELTPDEVAAIDVRDTGQRGRPDPDTVDTDLFSFAVDN